MVMRYILILLTALASTGVLMAKPVTDSSAPQRNAKMKTVTGQRKYRLVVNEGNDSTVTEFNRGLESVRGNMGNRGFVDNLVGLYKTSAAGQAVSLTSSLVDLGVNTLIQATKSRQPEWEKAVRRESKFTRHLPMQMEILDFYRNPSVNGALDPTDMNFNGFGCKQVIEYTDEDGNIREDEVFYVSCKVRDDDQGKARMLHHSKFEVEIDTLRFNYVICDLPNDSLRDDTGSRIGFSFDKRKNLKFIVDATITSSWINQAMMVFKDQPLGEFRIVASIDPAMIDEDGVFRYYSGRDRESGKDVMVTGDCFLVPRSYVGSTDMENNQDSWGTGQYKVEMNVSETCDINPAYYMTGGKWDSARWKPEWKKIKSRHKSPTFFQQALGLLSTQYKDAKWITVLAEPAKTVFIQYETEGVTRLLNPGTATPSVSGASGSKPAASSQNGLTSQSAGGDKSPK